jgi:hypothetical protein
MSRIDVFIVKISTRLQQQVTFACLTLLAVFGFAPAFAAVAVGEVTLTIGQAIGIPAAGVPLKLQRGSKVHVGDRIETAQGGHVHIRFVDGAMVSVRPTSRLLIEEYQYDAAHVAQSSVKFRLERGVTRAISGAAAEGARERFRLNTPLVAIGVRGTDFVVQTAADQTLAVVNQGSIVMAPFGIGCAQQDLGACGSASARLLSAEMGNLLVEFRSALAEPELRPFDSVRVPAVMTAGSNSTAATDGGPPRGANAVVRRDDNVLSTALVQEAVQQIVDTTASRTFVAPAPPAPPQLAVTPEPPAPPQLAWGRWGGAADSTDFTVPRTLAEEGRAVTVGNKDFILYRTEQGPATLPQGIGSVGFALNQTHARFTSDVGQIQAAQVQSGALTIDFTRRQFNTTLSLTSVPTGPTSLQASGSMRDDGIFVSRTAGQAVAGATALDGKSAGYLFEKAAIGGALSGITLWAR